MTDDTGHKKIFIGGTGRSGTTILSKFLGSHRKIYKMPLETRFIIDKGGLIDLFYSLTTNYSHDQSRNALKIFYDLMMTHITNPYSTPYLGHNFLKLVDSEFYHETFFSFFNKLQHGTFTAADYQSVDKFKTINSFYRKYFGRINKYYSGINRKISGKNKNIPYYGWPKEGLYIGHYFPDENELLALMNKFVDLLFSAVAKKHGKVHWCEDTPGNIMHLGFLHQVFKDGYFIHIVRNPIGVAYSMKNQFWAPDNYRQIIALLTNMYEKSIVEKKIAEKKNTRFIEIKLEELHTLISRDNLLTFLELDDNFDGSVKIQESKVNYYRNLMADAELRLLRTGLAKYLDHYQYA